MEDELCALADCFFVQFVWKDLVEIIRLELLILIAIPQPNLSIYAFHIFLLYGWCFFGFSTFNFQDIVIHMIFNFPSKVITTKHIVSDKWSI